MKVSAVSFEVDHAVFGWIPVGSGTIVKSHGIYRLLTAAHVADISKEHATRVCGFLDLEKEGCVTLDSIGYVTRPNDFDDWAIFDLPKKPKKTKAAKISAQLKTGQEVWLLGCPSRDCNVVTRGMVSDGESFSNAALLQAYALPGSSGGGVYNHKGDLVGVISAIGIGLEQFDPTRVWVVKLSSINKGLLKH